MVKLKCVKIYNYKSLKEVIIHLDDLTLIIGKNNCGKTSILEAIELALTYKQIGKEDVFAIKSEPFSLEKKVVIEMLFVPINDKFEEIPSFSDNWFASLGDRIEFDKVTGNDYFALKAEIAYDKDKEKYINKKFTIKTWKEEEESISGNSLSRDELELFNALYINAQRDLSLDINDRASQWAKITSNITISDQEKDLVMKKINKINEKIIKSNPLLKLVVNDLKEATIENKGNINLTPITKDLAHLYRGMNVYYEDFELESTSIERLGLGIRSWSSFSVIKTFVENEVNKNKENNRSYFPLFLIEEPESHLHPQAQRHFSENIKKINLQKVITSHSPYIISQISLEKILYIDKKDGISNITHNICEGLTREEIKNITTKVMNTRGELLYSNYVILVEGETEEFSFPEYFKKYFGKYPFELGVSIISVGGCNYKPFITILGRLNTKWVLFSDCEKETISTIDSTLKSLKLETSLTNPNVFILPENYCIETYLVDCNFIKEICNAINKCYKYDYINAVKRKYNGRERSKEISKKIFGDDNHLTKDYTQKNWKEILLKDILLSGKTVYNREIASEICDSRKQLPLKILEMFKHVETELKGGK